jgi:hypothetical protein
MITKQFWAISLFLILAAGLAAQEVRLAGPVSGFVADPQTRSLRAVAGVPGAAYVGDAVLSDVEIAAAAPRGGRVLAARGGQLCAIQDLSAESPECAPLEGAIADVDRVVWAGDAAWVVSSTGRRAQLWKDWSGAAATVDLGEMGRIVSLAGTAEAAAAATSDGAIYLIETGSAPRLLARVGRAGGISVAGTDLLITDRDAGQVLRIRNFAEGGAPELLAGAGHGLEDPVGAVVDGGRLYVASGAGRAVSVFEYPSMEFVTRLAVDFEPARLELLAGKLYLLNLAEGGETLQVLQAGDEPAVFFVPAGRASGEEE